MNTIINGQKPKKNKHSQLVTEIKDLIIDGSWDSGSRLPTYFELEEQFKVSRVTMQQAINQLKQDGFVTSVERHGLFVSEQLPHLDRLGILFPSTEQGNAFRTELVNSANIIGEAANKKFEVYRNVAEPFTSIKEVERLCEDIKAKRLAGLIFCYSAQAEETDPFIYPSNSLPRIVLYEDGLPASFYLALDVESLICRGLDWLESQGCKRIALMCQEGDVPEFKNLRIYREEVKNRGLHSPYEWQLQLRNFPIADNVVRLLLSLPKEERPEALFIGDDNLTEHVVKGIVATGIKVPEELVVLSHCNWGEKLPNAIPIKYLGFDIREIIKRSIKAFDNFHGNISQPNTYNIPALFEEELDW